MTETNYLVPIVAAGNINKESGKSDFCIVLDNLNDVGNIGTIVRTCHAFGINRIVSAKEDFDLFQKKTVDASRGRVFSTNVKTYKNSRETIQYL